MNRPNKIFKNQKDSKLNFVIVPFAKVPYQGKPMRYQGQWWVRKSYYNIVPWEYRKLEEFQCRKGIYMDMDELVVIMKSDLSKNQLNSILYEFSQEV